MLLSAVVECAFPIGNPPPNPLVEPRALAGATPRAPAAGERSYAETVRWLTLHMDGHANYTSWVAGRPADAQERLREDGRACLLVVALETVGVRDGPRSVRYVSLAEADAERIATCAVTGATPCACLAGSRRLSLEVAGTGETNWLRDDRICFDSRDAARRATEALLHAAVLCGARQGTP